MSNQKVAAVKKGQGSIKKIAKKIDLTTLRVTPNTAIDLVVLGAILSLLPNYAQGVGQLTDADSLTSKDSEDNQKFGMALGSLAGFSPEILLIAELGKNLHNNALSTLGRGNYSHLVISDRDAVDWSKDFSQSSSGKDFTRGKASQELVSTVVQDLMEASSPQLISEKNYTPSVDSMKNAANQLLDVMRTLFTQEIEELQARVDPNDQELEIAQEVATETPGISVASAGFDASSLLGLLGLGGGGGGGGGSVISSVSGSLVSSSSFSGVVIDDYVSGATVFFDADGDLTYTEGELTATTDATGNFTFTGTVDLTKGNIISTGGTDIASGATMTTMVSGGTSGYITPISTMYTYGGGATTLAAAGLSVSDLLYDPIAALSSGGTNSTTAALMIQTGQSMLTLLSNASAIVSSASSTASSFDSLIAVMSQVKTLAAGGTSVSDILSDTTNMTSVLTGALTNIVGSDNISTYTDLISNSASAIATVNNSLMSLSYADMKSGQNVSIAATGMVDLLSSIKIAAADPTDTTTLKNLATSYNTENVALLQVTNQARLSMGKSNGSGITTSADTISLASAGVGVDTRKTLDVLANDTAAGGGKIKIVGVGMYDGYAKQGKLVSANNAAKTLVLDQDLTASLFTNYANDRQISIVSGKGAGQVRHITGYNSATKTVTLDSAFDDVPDMSSGYYFSQEIPAYLKIGTVIDRTTGKELLQFENLSTTEMGTKNLVYVVQKEGDPQGLSQVGLVTVYLQPPVVNITMPQTKFNLQEASGVIGDVTNSTVINIAIDRVTNLGTDGSITITGLPKDIIVISYTTYATPGNPPKIVSKAVGATSWVLTGNDLIDADWSTLTMKVSGNFSGSFKPKVEFTTRYGNLYSGSSQVLDINIAPVTDGFKVANQTEINSYSLSFDESVPESTKEDTALYLNKNNLSAFLNNLRTKMIDADGSEVVGLEIKLSSTQWQSVDFKGTVNHTPITTSDGFISFTIFQPKSEPLIQGITSLSNALSTIALIPKANYAGDASITVNVGTVEKALLGIDGLPVNNTSFVLLKNGAANATLTASLQIQAVADTPESMQTLLPQKTLSEQQLNTDNKLYEWTKIDSLVSLPSINTIDTDGSEKLFVVIKPSLSGKVNISLKEGTVANPSYTSLEANFDGSYIISANDYAKAVIRGNSYFKEKITLDVSSYSQEYTYTGNTATPVSGAKTQSIGFASTELVFNPLNSGVENILVKTDQHIKETGGLKAATSLQLSISNLLVNTYSESASTILKDDNEKLYYQIELTSGISLQKNGITITEPANKKFIFEATEISLIKLIPNAFYSGDVLIKITPGSADKVSIGSSTYANPTFDGSASVTSKLTVDQVLETVQWTSQQLLIQTKQGQTSAPISLEKLFAETAWTDPNESISIRLVLPNDVDLIKPITSSAVMSASPDFTSGLTTYILTFASQDNLKQNLTGFTLSIDKDYASPTLSGIKLDISASTGFNGSNSLSSQHSYGGGLVPDTLIVSPAIIDPTKPIIKSSVSVVETNDTVPDAIKPFLPVAAWTKMSSMVDLGLTVIQDPSEQKFIVLTPQQPSGLTYKLSNGVIKVFDSQLTLTEAQFSEIQIRGNEKASGDFKINVQTKVVQVGWESTPVLSEAVTVTLKVNAIASGLASKLELNSNLTSLESGGDLNKQNQAVASQKKLSDFIKSSPTLNESSSDEKVSYEVIIPTGVKLVANSNINLPIAVATVDGNKYQINAEDLSKYTVVSNDYFSGNAKIYFTPGSIEPNGSKLFLIKDLQSVNLIVTPVADIPTSPIKIKDISFNESQDAPSGLIQLNTLVKLPSLVSVDSSETLFVKIELSSSDWNSNLQLAKNTLAISESSMPVGWVIDKSTNGKVILSLPASEYASLFVTGKAYFSGNSTINISTYSSENNSPTIVANSANQTVSLTINPLASGVNASLTLKSGLISLESGGSLDKIINSNQSIHSLYDFLSTAAILKDNSETLFYKISIPKSVNLLAINSFSLPTPTLDSIGNLNYLIQSNNLNNVNVVPQKFFSGNVSLSFTPVSIESNGLQSSIGGATVTATLTVSPVVDEPTIIAPTSVSGIISSDNDGISIPIQAIVADRASLVTSDPGETISIELRVSSLGFTAMTVEQKTDTYFAIGNTTINFAAWSLKDGQYIVKIPSDKVADLSDLKFSSSTDFRNENSIQIQIYSTVKDQATNSNASDTKGFLYPTTIELTAYQKVGEPLFDFTANNIIDIDTQVEIAYSLTLPTNLSSGSVGYGDVSVMFTGVPDGSYFMVNGKTVGASLGDGGVWIISGDDLSDNKNPLVLINPNAGASGSNPTLTAQAFISDTEALTSNQQLAADSLKLKFDPTLSDPLVLSVNSSEIISSSIKVPVGFDLNDKADGLEQPLAWLSYDASFLQSFLIKSELLSLSSDNQSIRLSTHLFADFNELESYIDDSNNNQILDSKEISDKKIGLWTDLDVDGRVDSGELVLLKETGANALSISKNETIFNSTDANGLVTFYQSNASYGGNSSSKIYAVGIPYAAAADIPSINFKSQPSVKFDLIQSKFSSDEDRSSILLKLNLQEAVLSSGKVGDITHMVKLIGLPPESFLSAGIHVKTNTDDYWLLKDEHYNNEAGITVSFSPNYSGSFEISAQAIASALIDGVPNKIVSTLISGATNQFLFVSGVADAPILKLGDAPESIDEGGRFNLSDFNINVISSDDDIGPEAENLYIKFKPTDVLNGNIYIDNISLKVNNSGYYELTNSDWNKAYIQFDDYYYGDKTFNISGISRQNNTEAESNFTADISLHLNAVADGVKAFNPTVLNPTLQEGNSPIINNVSAVVKDSKNEDVYFLVKVGGSMAATEAITGISSSLGSSVKVSIASVDEIGSSVAFDNGIVTEGLNYWRVFTVRPSEVSINDTWNAGDIRFAIDPYYDGELIYSVNAVSYDRNIGVSTIDSPSNVTASFIINPEVDEVGNDLSRIQIVDIDGNEIQSLKLDESGSGSKSQDFKLTVAGLDADESYINNFILSDNNIEIVKNSGDTYHLQYKGGGASFNAVSKLTSNIVFSDNLPSGIGGTNPDAESIEKFIEIAVTKRAEVPVFLQTTDEIELQAFRLDPPKISDSFSINEKGDGELRIFQLMHVPDWVNVSNGLIISRDDSTATSTVQFTEEEFSSSIWSTANPLISSVVTTDTNLVLRVIGVEPSTSEMVSVDQSFKIIVQPNFLKPADQEEFSVAKNFILYEQIKEGPDWGSNYSVVIDRFENPNQSLSFTNSKGQVTISGISFDQPITLTRAEFLTASITVDAFADGNFEVPLIFKFPKEGGSFIEQPFILNYALNPVITAPVFDGLSSNLLNVHAADGSVLTPLVKDDPKDVDNLELLVLIDVGELRTSGDPDEKLTIELTATDGLLTTNSYLTYINSSGEEIRIEESSGKIILDQLFSAGSTTALSNAQLHLIKDEITTGVKSLTLTATNVESGATVKVTDTVISTESIIITNSKPVAPWVGYSNYGNSDSVNSLLSKSIALKDIIRIPSDNPNLIIQLLGFSGGLLPVGIGKTVTLNSHNGVNLSAIELSLNDLNQTLITGLSIGEPLTFSVRTGLPFGDQGNVYSRLIDFNALLSVSPSGDIILKGDISKYSKQTDFSDDVVLVSGTGSPILGGSGTDTLIVDPDHLIADNERGVILDMGLNSMFTPQSGDSLHSDIRSVDQFEIIVGSSGKDELVGDAYDQTDLILRGGASSDRLIGGAGNDVLEGGSGNDVLKGSRGSDTFVIAAGSDNDTVVDFNSLDDRIVISGSVAPEDLMSLIHQDEVSGNWKISMGDDSLELLNTKSLTDAYMKSLIDSGKIVFSDSLDLEQGNLFASQFKLDAPVQAITSSETAREAFFGDAYDMSDFSFSSLHTPGDNLNDVLGVVMDAQFKYFIAYNQTDQLSFNLFGTDDLNKSLPSYKGLSGSSHDDKIIAQAHEDSVLYGGSDGNDVLIGGAHRDTFVIGEKGTSANSNLDSNGPHEVNDHLTGNAGADNFVFVAPESIDKVLSTIYNLKIHDFNRDEGDRITTIGWDQPHFGITLDDPTSLSRNSTQTVHFTHDLIDREPNSSGPNDHDAFTVVFDLSFAREFDANFTLRPADFDKI